MIGHNQSLLTGLISVLTSLMLLSATPAVAGAADPRSAAKPPIRSGCEYDYPPYCIVSSDTHAGGFSVELLTAALAAMGREVTFKIGRWSEIKTDLAAGRIQVLPLVGRTPEREAVYDFTVPYLTMHGTIVVREDETGIRTLADLKGKRVAVLDGDNAEEFLRRNNPGAEIVTTASFEVALKELAAGRHDAVVIQKLLALQLIKQLGLTNLKTTGPPLTEFVQSFCFAVRDGDRELLSLVNEGLAIVMADGTFQRLYVTWFAPIESTVKSRVVIGGDYNYPPYEFLDENGEPAGYNVDLTRLIAREMGMDAEIRLGSWAEIKKMLATGEIDAVQGMFYKPERDLIYDFSKPHTVVSHVIVTRTGAAELNTLADLAGKSILVMDGDIMQEVAIAQGYETQLVCVRTQEEALRLLAAGNYDCALLAKVPVLYWLRKNRWDNLRVGDHAVHAAEYCYAVSHDNVALLRRLAAGLDIIAAGDEYRRIREKWLGRYEGPGLGDVLTYALLIAAPLILLLVGSMIWSRTLRRKVQERTAALRREIEGRERVEAELQRARDNLETQIRERTAALRKLSLAVEQSPNIVVVTDTNANIEYVNEKFIEVTGYTRAEAIGRNPRILQSGKTQPEEYEKLWECLNAGREWRGIFYNRKKNGEYFIEAAYIAPLKDEHGTVTHYVANKEDITEKWEMQKKLAQSEKLAALGELSASIAHELNNPIGIVLGYADFLQARLKDGDAKTAEQLAMIRDQALRCKTIVADLLTFAKRRDFDLQPIILNDVVDSSLVMIRADLEKHGIAVELRLESNLPPVRSNYQHLQQVFINLCSNAIQAMAAVEPEPGSTGRPRKLTLITYQIGSDAYLSIADTGPGMDQNTMNKIFTPFFTTKEKGTGLGLAICNRIIENMAGAIEVQSVQGKGSEFIVKLQVHE